MKERYDENGQLIGDGNTHCAYHVEDFHYLPVRAIVAESCTSESVYVTYINTESLATAKVRFSTHISNDIKFGMVVDGRSSNARNEILYRLGFIDRVFIPSYRNLVTHQAVAKKKLHLYVECDKTLSELIALPEGTDISEYKGKLAKGSTEMITSSIVKRVECGGHFEYIKK